MGEFRYRDIVTPDGIPAIVPKDLFARVQDRLAKNKKAPARTKSEDEYLLTTKLFCGYCGAYLYGESGTARNGTIHRYYKCVSVKKKRTECHKKPAKKAWIEDLVIRETMGVIMDDARVDAIVSKVMELQTQESSSLPLYEKQLREAESAIENILDAIQQGILTKSTKSRLEGLEALKEEMEVKIACEKMAKPKLTDEQVRHWILRFRMLDMTKKEHRQKLIDTFVNAIYLYNDKAILVFNYKEGSKTVDFSEDYSAVSGSDIECSGVPILTEKTGNFQCSPDFSVFVFFLNEAGSIL